MTDTALELPSYPQGSTVEFIVTDAFPQPKGPGGLVRSAHGDVFYIQHIPSQMVEGGGIMVSIIVPADTVTFTVDRSFASGYLILTDINGAMYFATRVVKGAP